MDPIHQYRMISKRVLLKIECVIRYPLTSAPYATLSSTFLKKNESGMSFALPIEIRILIKTECECQHLTLYKYMNEKICMKISIDIYEM